MSNQRLFKIGDKVGTMWGDGEVADIVEKDAWPIKVFIGEGRFGEGRFESCKQDGTHYPEHKYPSIWHKGTGTPPSVGVRTEDTDKDETIRKLRADLAEADRRAGAAERENAQLRESEAKRHWWLSKAKEEAGFTDRDSFDDVWAHVLQLATKNKELSDD